MAQRLETKQRIVQAKEIREALDFWGKNMVEALDSRFGVAKVGYFTSIFPYGNLAQVSWKSSARVESLIPMLRGLAHHLETDKSGIVKPSKEDIGHFG